MPLWKDKQNTAYIFDGMLCDNKKELSDNTSLDVSENSYIELILIMPLQIYAKYSSYTCTMIYLEGFLLHFPNSNKKSENNLNVCSMEKL